MKYFLLATILVPSISTLFYGLGEWTRAADTNAGRELAKHGKILAAIGGGIIWLIIFFSLL